MSRLRTAGLLTVAIAATFGLVRAPQVWAQSPASNTAQDISGTWQGTLHAERDLRTVVKITKAGDGAYKAQFFSIDQPGQPFSADSVTLAGSIFKLTINFIGGSYEGKLSADGQSISGTWTQANGPRQLDFTRATPETAWTIPPPPPSIPPMAADANPSFEVAAIKPNSSGAPRLQDLGMRGRKFIARNASLEDLIVAAFNVQKQQIVSGPGWMQSERYDIDAIPDAPGGPNTDQFRGMVQKLLADRFSMKFHHERREMLAYVLTVGKAGTKLTPTALKGPPLTGIGSNGAIRLVPIKGGITLHGMDVTMRGFTLTLQVLVLDRPVVDRTGLTDHYDFDCTFAPDDTQFGGHPPQLPSLASGSGGITAPTADTTYEPSLFEAISQQLGLKLSAEKTDVDVIVIDHIEKPSPN